MDSERKALGGSKTPHSKETTSIGDNVKHSQRRQPPDLNKSSKSGRPGKNKSTGLPRGVVAGVADPTSPNSNLTYPNDLSAFPPMKHVQIVGVEAPVRKREIRINPKSALKERTVTDRSSAYSRASIMSAKSTLDMSRKTEEPLIYGDVEVRLNPLYTEEQSKRRYFLIKICIILTVIIFVAIGIVVAVILTLPIDDPATTKFADIFTETDYNVSVVSTMSTSSDEIVSTIATSQILSTLSTLNSITINSSTTEATP